MFNIERYIKAYTELKSINSLSPEVPKYLTEVPALRHFPTQRVWGIAGIRPAEIDKVPFPSWDMGLPVKPVIQGGNPLECPEVETIDTISLDKIKIIIEDMKSRKFKFKLTSPWEIHKNMENFSIPIVGYGTPLSRKTEKVTTVDRLVEKVMLGIIEENFLNSKTTYGLIKERSRHSVIKEIKGWTGIT